MRLQGCLIDMMLKANDDILLKAGLWKRLNFFLQHFCRQTDIFNSCYI